MFIVFEIEDSRVNVSSARRLKFIAAQERRPEGVTHQGLEAGSWQWRHMAVLWTASGLPDSGPTRAPRPPLYAEAQPFLRPGKLTSLSKYIPARHSPRPRLNWQRIVTVVTASRQRLRYSYWVNLSSAARHAVEGWQGTQAIGTTAVWRRAGAAPPFHLLFFRQCGGTRGGSK